MNQATVEEPCDAVLEHPAGSWLLCQAKGKHCLHRAQEPMGREHVWRDEVEVTDDAA